VCVWGGSCCVNTSLRSVPADPWCRTVQIGDSAHSFPSANSTEETTRRRLSPCQLPAIGLTVQHAWIVVLAGGADCEQQPRTAVRNTPFIRTSEEIKSKAAAPIGSDAISQCLKERRGMMSFYWPQAETPQTVVRCLLWPRK